MTRIRDRQGAPVLHGAAVSVPGGPEPGCGVDGHAGASRGVSVRQDAPDGRLRGLEAGRVTVSARRELRERIAALPTPDGFVAAGQLILGSRPRFAEEMFVKHVLTAIRRVGKTKSRTMMRKTGIRADARLNELTDRQRHDLARVLLEAAKSG